MLHVLGRTDAVDRRGGLWVIAAASAVGGLILGSLDLLAQGTLPYPWANLANSTAVWALGAFGIGGWAGCGRWRPAAAGALLLLVAVEAYYLTAIVLLDNNLSNLWAPTTLAWLLFGALAGVVFGTAGGWWRGANRWLHAIGVALPAAVLLAEAGVLVYRSGSGDAAYRVDSLQTAAIEAALGALIPLVVGRTLRQRLHALAVGVSLGLLGFGSFILTGFGG
jgi:hypothetical protein